MAAPIRTCIGCRRRDAAAEMVRLRLLVQPERQPGGQPERQPGGQPGKQPGGQPGKKDGQVEIVVAGSSTGRGASLHARPACLDTGLRPDVLSRAFKRRVTVRDTAELLQRITIASRRKR